MEDALHGCEQISLRNQCRTIFAIEVDPALSTVQGNVFMTVLPERRIQSTVESIEPSTYGLIGIAALGAAFIARRRKLKTA